MVPRLFEGTPNQPSRARAGPGSSKSKGQKDAGFLVRGGAHTRVQRRGVDPRDGVGSQRPGHRTLTGAGY